MDITSDIKHWNQSEAILPESQNPTQICRPCMDLGISNTIDIALLLFQINAQCSGEYLKAFRTLVIIQLRSRLDIIATAEVVDINVQLPHHLKYILNTFQVYWRI